MQDAPFVARQAYPDDVAFARVARAKAEYPDRLDDGGFRSDCLTGNPAGQSGRVHDGTQPAGKGGACRAEEPNSGRSRARTELSIIITGIGISARAKTIMIEIIIIIIIMVDIDRRSPARLCCPRTNTNKSLLWDLNPRPPAY
jgi:hypothetical protein